MFVVRGGVMQDVSAIARGLTRGSDGIWRSRSHRAVDYPDEANAFCFAVEDGSFWFQHRNAVIVDVVRRFPPAGFIADIGAGNGYVSRGLNEAGFETLVLEPGPSGIQNARTRGLSPLICATLQDAAFRPESLPAAAMFDVLEHIEDDIGVLRLLHQAIVPGGRIYLTVPSFQLLWSSEDDVAGHHRRYTIATLNTQLRGAGFIPEFGTYFFAPLPPPIFLLRSIPTRLGFRQATDVTRISQELQPSEGSAVKIVRALLNAERTLLHRGWRVPTGSSCLVVARKAEEVISGCDSPTLP
jgi:SAM-dependent methyltransferase